MLARTSASAVAESWRFAPRRATLPCTNKVDKACDRSSCDGSTNMRRPMAAPVASWSGSPPGVSAKTVSINDSTTRRDFPVVVSATR